MQSALRCLCLSFGFVGGLLSGTTAFGGIVDVSGVSTIRGDEPNGGGVVRVSSSGTKFAVVWPAIDVETGLFGIYLQTYDETGTALSEQRQANTSANYNHLTPTVAYLESGEFVVVWTREDPLTGDSVVVGQRFDEPGEPVGEEIAISPIGESSVSAPIVESLHDGGFVVVWRSDEADTVRVHGQQMDAQGNAVGQVLEIDEADAAIFGINRVAVSGGNENDFVVVWSHAEYTGVSYAPIRHEVRARLFGADGTATSNPVSVESSLGAQGRDGLDVDHLSTGEFVVVWSDGMYSDVSAPGTFNVMAREFNSDGTPVDNTFQVNTRGPSDYNEEGYGGVSIATDSLGGIVVVWSSISELGGGGESKTYLQRLDVMNSVDGNEIEISTLNDRQNFEPDVSTSDAKTCLVGWLAETTTGELLGRGRYYAVTPQDLVCGDATLDGDVTATDALIALNAAVDVQYCSLRLCDVNASDGITATDALAILQVAVGLSTQTQC